MWAGGTGGSTYDATPVPPDAVSPLTPQSDMGNRHRTARAESRGARRTGAALTANPVDRRRLADMTETSWTAHSWGKGHAVR